jgi:hypothetical protein
MRARAWSRVCGDRQHPAHRGDGRHRRLSGERADMVSRTGCLIVLRCRRPCRQAERPSSTWAVGRLRSGRRTLAGAELCPSSSGSLRAREDRERGRAAGPCSRDAYCSRGGLPAGIDHHSLVGYLCPGVAGSSPLPTPLAGHSSICAASCQALGPNHPKMCSKSGCNSGGWMSVPDWSRFSLTPPLSRRAARGTTPACG